MNKNGGVGNLIIVSGPSGSGKTTLASAVLQSMPRLNFSVSYTTRAPRSGEKHGVEYFFVDRAQFQSLVREGRFLEWAEVHGHYYGTPRDYVEDLLRQGQDVLLDIDVQGARIIRRERRDAVGVFVLPPSYEVLRERLLRRSLDEGLVIEQRLKTARREIVHYKDYDYLIINDDLGRSTEELRCIIAGTRCRIGARIESAKAVVATFGGMDAEDP